MKDVLLLPERLTCCRFLRVSSSTWLFSLASSCTLLSSSSVLCFSYTHRTVIDREHLQHSWCVYSPGSVRSGTLCFPVSQKQQLQSYILSRNTLYRGRLTRARGTGDSLSSRCQTAPREWPVSQHSHSASPPASSSVSPAQSGDLWQ